MSEGMDKRRERYGMAIDVYFDDLDREKKRFCVDDSGRGRRLKCYSDKSAAKDICYILNKLETDLDDRAKWEIGDCIFDEIIEGEQE